MNNVILSPTAFVNSQTATLRICTMVAGFNILLHFANERNLSSGELLGMNIGVLWSTY